MRVLVVGGTGRVGRRVVEKLREAGHVPTVFARDTSTVPEGIRSVAGDVRDREAVREALDGQDAVMSALGTPPGAEADDTLSVGIETLVAAMWEAGVGRIVAVGAAGVLDAPGGGLRLGAADFPSFLREVAAEHRRAYETLADSELEWTLVCPPNMPDGPATGGARVERDRLPEGGERVTTGDVAAFVLRALEAGPTGRVGIAAQATGGPGSRAGAPELGVGPGTRPHAARCPPPGAGC
jgi:putative NADH-flavin reductase